MRWAGYLLLGVVLACALGYLSWFNAETVELRLGRDWIVRAPLGAQLTFAFLGGATMVLIGTGLRESRRALARWRQQRRARREARTTTLVAEGRRLLWSGETDRARALLLRASKQRPTRETLLALADACVIAGHPQDARRILQNADTDLAGDPDVLSALADVCRRTGDATAAITALERARQRHPRAARVLRELRELYIEAERWNEAAAVHAETIALQPLGTSASDQNLLAGTRYQAALRIPGREARLQALEEVLGHFPRFVPVVVSLGDELVAAGRTADAVRLWEYTFRQQPRAVLAERLASMAHDRPARDRLRTTLRKLRGDHVDRSAAHLLTAQLFLEDGQLDAAGSELEAIGPPHNTAPPFQLTSARLNERRGQVEQALNAYRRAVNGGAAYHCTVCNRVAPAWQAFCVPCRRWDTFRAAIEFVRN